jgi:hypothetical protein
MPNGHGDGSAYEINKIEPVFPRGVLLLNSLILKMSYAVYLGQG